MAHSIPSGPTLPLLTGRGAELLAQGQERVIVTGAGGWLGLATLEMLHGLLGDLFHRRVVCFGATERRLSLRGGIDIAQHPLSALATLPAASSVVLHLAFQTKGAMGMPAAEYIDLNRAIGSQVADVLDRIGARAVFVASSGAAYLADSVTASPFKRLYGSLKLEDEARFSGWGKDTGNHVVIARVFNIAGPYINNRSHYALACFIADALADRPIEIHATNRVYRSFVAIGELMSIVFGTFANPGNRVVRFDTAGDAILEMGEVAEAVALVLDHHRGIHRPPINEKLEADYYVGDGSTYHALRQSFTAPPTTLENQICQTADYMRDHPEAE